MLRTASVSAVPDVNSAPVTAAGTALPAARELAASNAAALLSPEDRRKRAEAVRFANASVKLEGFEVSAEDHARADRFIAGEIDLAEFLQGQ